MKPQTELCEKCGQKQSCVGDGKLWLCMDCWNAQMAQTGKLVRKLQDEFEHRRTDRAEK